MVYSIGRSGGTVSVGGEVLGVVRGEVCGEVRGEVRSEFKCEVDEYRGDYRASVEMSGCLLEYFSRCILLILSLR